MNDCILCPRHCHVNRNKEVGFCKANDKLKIAKADLFYYEELSTEQIAQVMKTKPATVRSYLHRGREKLKEMMEADA